MTIKNPAEPQFIWNLNELQIFVSDASVLHKTQSKPTKCENG